MFIRFAAITSLIYGALVYLGTLATEDFLLRRYLAAVVERAVSELEHPDAENAGRSMLERVPRLSGMRPDRTHLASAEVVRFYVRASPDLPAWAPSYGPGTYRRLDDGAMLRVASLMNGADTLYAVVDGDGLLDTDDFGPYLVLALLLIGAAVTALGGAVGAVLARQLAQPLVRLTDEVAAHGEGPADFSGMQRADEVGALSRGFASLVDRLSDFLQREREFTRFASHELRTPVAVFKSSLSLLRATSDASARDRAFARMTQSAEEMEALVATFLALGRSPEDPASVDMKEIHVAREIGAILLRLSPLSEQKNLDIGQQVDGSMRISAPPGLAVVLMDNLLRNAVAHAGTWIRVQATGHCFEIQNDVLAWPGSPSSTGYGLQIVARICKRQGWVLSSERSQSRYAVRVVFDAQAMSIRQSP